MQSLKQISSSLNRGTRLVISYKDGTSSIFYEVTSYGASLFKPNVWVLEQSEELALASDPNKSKQFVIGVTLIKDPSTEEHPGYQIVCVPLNFFCAYPTDQEIQEALRTIEASK